VGRGTRVWGAVTGGAKIIFQSAKECLSHVEFKNLKKKIKKNDPSCKQVGFKIWHFF